MESNRQKKFGKLIQQEMSELLPREIAVPDSPLLTVTVVRMTADMGIARVYISVLPDQKGAATIEFLNENKGEARYLLGKRIRKQVRHIPELEFYLDDTLQEVERMDDLFRQIQDDPDAK